MVYHGGEAQGQGNVRATVILRLRDLSLPPLEGTSTRQICCSQKQAHRAAGRLEPKWLPLSLLLALALERECAPTLPPPPEGELSVNLALWSA